MVKVFEVVKINHYDSGNNSDRHGLRNNRYELNIYRILNGEQLSVVRFPVWLGRRIKRFVK